MSMSPEDAEEYTQALGQVVAGGYRHVKLGDSLGVPKALGLSTAQWVQDRLGGYVQMSIPERREAVKELEAEGFNNVESAEILGVDESTVRADKKKSGNPESSEADQQKPKPHSGNPEPVEPDEDALAEELIAKEHERERKIRSDRYTGIAEAVMTVGDYGRYQDVPALMREYDPTELDPPQLDRYLEIGHLQSAARLVHELIDWRKNALR